MKTYFLKTKFFVLPFIVFLLAGGVVLLLFSKAQIHIFINEHNSKAADLFFKYYTNVGDGLIPLLVSLSLLLFSVRKAFLFGLSGALAGIISQLFKQLIFPAFDRPKLFFQNAYNLHFVPGVEIHSSHSFPSGHTATAFCLFLVLSYYTKKRGWQSLWFMLALLVGYSRMYLSQHFFVDVYFGAIMGVFSALAVYFCMKKFRQEWLDKSIIKIVSKKNEQRF
jgi:membrane-associated phospholipid phosphatase